MPVRMANVFRAFYLTTEPWLLSAHVNRELPAVVYVPNLPGVPPEQHGGGVWVSLN